jgi:hypothetical protein
MLWPTAQKNANFTATFSIINIWDDISIPCSKLQYQMLVLNSAEAHSVKTAL